MTATRKNSCERQRQSDHRTSDVRDPSRMRDGRRSLSRRPDPQPLEGRQAAAGALRPRRREEGADQGRAGAASRRSVALPRDAAGAKGCRHRQPRRSHDAADPPAEACEETRRRRDHRQGRGTAADRLVQGARPRHGGVDGQGARHQAHGDADQRQCRRGAGGLRHLAAASRPRSSARPIRRR